MTDIARRLEDNGLGTGPRTYGWYSDAESFLCRAVWCTALHTQPEVVIETGVAHGVTSRIVLEALSQNDRGHLWSIDLPHPFDHRLHVDTGVAVTDDCRAPVVVPGRHRAGSGCRRWSPRSARWSCSSTTACTPPRTRCSRWSRPPRSCRRAGSCWWTTSSAHDGLRRRLPGATRVPDHHLSVRDRNGMFGIAVNTGPAESPARLGNRRVAVQRRTFPPPGIALSPRVNAGNSRARE